MRSGYCGFVMSGSCHYLPVPRPDRLVALHLRSGERASKIDITRILSSAEASVFDI